MDFTLTSEQEALRDSVRRFTEREYDFDKRKSVLRSPSGLDPQHWATFAELGWLGAGLSEEAGGFGGGAVENALIAEELGRALVTEPFVAHVVATHLLSDVRADLVAEMVMGERRIVPALQEPDGRGDVKVVSTVVAGGRLSGTKSLVEGGAVADLLIVSADTGLYLVDPAGPGVARHDYRTLDNRRVSDFTFDGAPAELVVEDAGERIDNAVDQGLVTLCGEALGAMDAALWMTRDYLRTRKQFGVAIGSFQALQHRMADMLIEVELTRSALFLAIGAADSMTGDARTLAVSAAKAQVATAAALVGGQAIQLHGGIGVTEELIISHYYRRLYVIARQFGDGDLHVGRFAGAVDRLAGG